MDPDGSPEGFLIDPQGFPKGVLIDPHGVPEGFLIDPQLQWVEHQKGAPTNGWGDPRGWLRGGPRKSSYSPNGWKTLGKVSNRMPETEDQNDHQKGCPPMAGVA
jgi:hypothetical protein